MKMMEIPVDTSPSSHTCWSPSFEKYVHSKHTKQRCVWHNCRGMTSHQSLSIYSTYQLYINIPFFTMGGFTGLWHQGDRTYEKVPLNPAFPTGIMGMPQFTQKISVYCKSYNEWRVISRRVSNVLLIAQGGTYSMIWTFNLSLSDEQVM